MNKRIRKKRNKLDDRRIGDHLYSTECLININKLAVMNIIIKPMTIQNPQIKWKRANLKKALNHIIRRRRVDFSKMIPNKTFHQYQKKPLVLVEGETSTAYRRIPGGSCIRYKGHVINILGKKDGRQ